MVAALERRANAQQQWLSNRNEANQLHAKTKKTVFR